MISSSDLSSLGTSGKLSITRCAFSLKNVRYFFLISLVVIFSIITLHIFCNKKSPHPSKGRKLHFRGTTLVMNARIHHFHTIAPRQLHPNIPKTFTSRLLSIWFYFGVLLLFYALYFVFIFKLYGGNKSLSRQSSSPS